VTISNQALGPETSGGRDARRSQVPESATQAVRVLLSSWQAHAEDVHAQTHVTCGPVVPSGQGSCVVREHDA
jgi:hypothetical protein